MIYNLTKEQKDYVINTYGSNIVTVNKVVKILNELELPFADEEDFIDTVANIASIIETEKFEKSIGKERFERAGYTILTATVSVLNQKFNDSYLYDRNTTKKVSTLK